MEILICKCGATIEFDFDINANVHFIECYECNYENENISKERLIEDCINNGCTKE